MPSITVKNGKLKNPVATKLILTGEKCVDVLLEKDKIFSAKQSFCIVTLADHYIKNKDKYGEPNDYLDYLSSNFHLININTLKGVVLGTELNVRFIAKLKKHIQALILMEWHREHGKLKGL